MTKEEILNNQFNHEYIDELMDRDTIDKSLSAMDIYAQQECIAFFEFMVDNGYADFISSEPTNQYLKEYLRLKNQMN